MPPSHTRALIAQNVYFNGWVGIMSCLSVTVDRKKMNYIRVSQSHCCFLLVTMLDLSIRGVLTSVGAVGPDFDLQVVE